MKRASKVLATLAAIIASFVVGRSSLRFWPGLERTTLISLSPDDSKRIRLVEIPSEWVDRNFELRLEDIKAFKVKTIFRSPDEGRPEGSERIIWSKDGNRIILTGRHFVVREHTPSFDGGTLYLMYDLPTGRIWCNASQQSSFPPFGLEDVDSLQWTNER